MENSQKDNSLSKNQSKLPAYCEPHRKPVKVVCLHPDKKFDRLMCIQCLKSNSYIPMNFFEDYDDIFAVDKLETLSTWETQHEGESKKADTELLNYLSIVDKLFDELKTFIEARACDLKQNLKSKYACVNAFSFDDIQFNELILSKAKLKAQRVKFEKGEVKNDQVLEEYLKCYQDFKAVFNKVEDLIKTHFKIDFEKLLNDLDFSIKNVKNTIEKDIVRIIDENITSRGNPKPIIEINDLQLTKTVQTGLTNLGNLCYMDDIDNLAVSGKKDKNAAIMVWQLSNLEFKYGFPAHTEKINNLKYIKTMKLLISASDDKTIKVWRCYDYQKVRSINHDKPVYAVEHNNLDLIYSAGEFPFIYVWDIGTGEMKKEIHTSATCNSLLFLKAKNLLVSSHFDCLVRIHEMNTYTLMFKFESHPGEFHRAMFDYSERDSLLFSVCHNLVKVMKIYENREPECIQIENMSSKVGKIAVLTTSTNNYLISNNEDTVIQITDIGSGKSVLKLDILEFSASSIVPIETLRMVCTADTKNGKIYVMEFKRPQARKNFF